MQTVTALKAEEIQLRIPRLQKKQGYNWQLEFFSRVLAESPFPPLSNNNTRKTRRFAEKDCPCHSTTPEPLCSVTKKAVLAFFVTLLECARCFTPGSARTALRDCDEIVLKGPFIDNPKYRPNRNWYSLFQIAGNAKKSLRGLAV